jgi:hypothetical protein
MAVKDWSTNASANGGVLTGITLDGAVMNVPLVDDAFRDLTAQVAQQLGKINWKGADMPSAATLDLATASGWYVDVTGTATINAMGSMPAGMLYILRFTGSLTLTNSATLILPGGANITTQNGDVVWMVSLGAGSWRCVSYVGTNPGFLWKKESDGTISLYNGATRMMNITAAGDLRMKGDVISDAAGV